MTYRPVGPYWRLGFLHLPVEEDFQCAVAGMCSYPAGLLRGPIDIAAEVLRARAELRLSERSGEFGGLDDKYSGDNGQTVADCSGWVDREL